MDLSSLAPLGYNEWENAISDNFFPKYIYIYIYFFFFAMNRYIMVFIESLFSREWINCH